MYGRELILDLYKCEKSCRFNREDIEEFLIKLCDLVDMEREDLHFWDYTEVRQDQIPYDQPHLVGTSAVQFISTSDIVIHTLDMLDECYINLFTCKPFDELKAVNFIVEYFGSQQYEYTAIVRGRLSKVDVNDS